MTKLAAINQNIYTGCLPRKYSTHQNPCIVGVVVGVAGEWTKIGLNGGLE